LTERQGDSMHLRRSPGALFLVVLASLVVLVAGCGGQSEGGSQGGDQGGDSQGGKGGGETAKQVPKRKVAVGTIVKVKSDKRRIVLHPSKEIQGGKRMAFKVRKNADIEFDDKKAELSQAKKGQQAQIQYITKNEVNRARSVDLFSGGGGEGTGS
jgi:hypothetical protein